MTRYVSYDLWLARSLPHTLCGRLRMQLPRLKNLLTSAPNPWMMSTHCFVYTIPEFRAVNLQLVKGRLSTDCYASTVGVQYRKLPLLRLIVRQREASFVEKVFVDTKNSLRKSDEHRTPVSMYIPTDFRVYVCVIRINVVAHSVSWLPVYHQVRI